VTQQAGEPLTIVGAGIAGLATALALARTGRTVRILEKRPRPANEGAGLQIGPNGTRILRDLGLADALAPLAGVPQGIDVYRGQSGRLLTTLPLGSWIEHRHGAPYWVLHRADLGSALEQAVRKAGVEIAYGVSGDGVDGGAVIGADGVWSEVRRQRIGAAVPRFTGRVALRARIPKDRAPLQFHRSITVWMAPSAHVVTYPILGGREINLVALVPGQDSGASWSVPVARDEVASRTNRFAYDLRALMAQAEHWRQWPLVQLPPLPSLARGTAVLVGDAGHPMLPFLAQGAVMALEDAMALAAAVKAHGDDLVAAFSAFDRARRLRTKRVVEAASLNGHIYHLAGPAAAARDLVLQITPAKLVMARYDWLYGAR
jgi:salicylate hydroxylase